METAPVVNLDKESRVKTTLPTMGLLGGLLIAVVLWAAKVDQGISTLVEQVSGMRQDMKEIGALDRRVSRHDVLIDSFEVWKSRMEARFEDRK